MVKQLLHKIAHKIAKTFYKIELVRVEHKYGVVRRNRLNPFNIEYLDLGIADDGYHGVKPGPNLTRPLQLKANWWKRQEHVKKYCLDEDMNRVYKALQECDKYKPVPVPKVPKVHVIKDPKIELAQFRIINGKGKE